MTATARAAYKNGMRTSALLAAGILGLAGCGGDGSGGSGSLPPSRTTADLDRARRLIETCRVRSTLSLHRGAFYLHLKDGAKLELPGGSEPEIIRAIQRATPRCGPVAIATE